MSGTRRDRFIPPARKKVTIHYCPKCGGKLNEVTPKESPLLHQTCEKCNHTVYNNPTPVVAAIIEYEPLNKTLPDEENVIILTQNKGWPSHLFALVSGFLEYQEDPKLAIIREVEEELGVKGQATVQELVGVYSFPQMNQVLIIYHVLLKAKYNSVDEDLKNLNKDEIAAYKVVPVSKLTPWPIGTGMGVADFVAKRSKSGGRSKL